jgi:hypothetical protein
MEVSSFITIFAFTVAITTTRYYWAFRCSKSGRESRLIKQAGRAAKSSQRASNASVRLSKASVELSLSASQFSTATEQAQQSDKMFQWVCLCLYRKWLLLQSRWLLGRAIQRRERAEIKFQRCMAIIDSLGIKNDA